MGTVEMQGLKVHFTGREKCLPGHFFGPAVRPHYLMHVVLGGKGFYEVGTNRYQLEAGDAFLIYPNEMTYYQADAKEPWEYAWVAFAGLDVNSILGQSGFSGRRMICKAEEKEEFLRLTEELVKSFQNREQNGLEVLGLFFQAMAKTDDGHFEYQEKYELKYYQKAVEYISNNYTYPLKINDVARYVGIDRTYLYKIFRDIRQQSPKQFLMEIRLNAAKSMLKTRDMGVTETAYSCGFKDGASFCSHFKKYIGTTPSRYKKE